MTQKSTKHQRCSIRLREYDYSQPGTYFVTVVTRGYKCIFGEIVCSKMQFYDLGRIAQDCWLQIPDHFTNVEIYPYVIMPNHMHGIITIHEDSGRGTIYRAPTNNGKVGFSDKLEFEQDDAFIKMIERFGKPVRGSIPTIIRTYKAAVSRRARQELGIVNIWQRNYYEHIVRNQADMENIHDYILTNPVTWADNPEYIS